MDRVGEDLLSPGRPDSQFALRIAGPDKIQKPLELQKRKNVRARMRLLRPRLCIESIIGPASTCLVLRISPIRRSILPGAPQFPDYARSSMNRISKTVCEKASIAEPNRFASPRFRRGISKSMRESGSTIGQSTNSAGWRAVGYRPYLTHRNNERKFTDSPIRALDTHRARMKGRHGRDTPISNCGFGQSGGLSMRKPRIFYNACL